MQSYTDVLRIVDPFVSKLRPEVITKFINYIT